MSERADYNWLCAKCGKEQGEHQDCITDPPASDCDFEPAQRVVKPKKPRTGPEFTPIVSTYVYPPIPVRHFDWHASRDGYEPGDHYGTGATELEAINDLLQIEWDNSEDKKQ